ncbi:hypothetical protein A3F00_04975 [Candidatus Daviesbacteria bacterium RIFCSPHIGHO2_12_FULL_37_11]|uniref:Peptidase S11 D-alanyl-D-alanine carboxypeptidase A N-terminal domain-containing protein n=1 Tax=Candidatus Daviesbacteria bacterium RIFCSPHIGHO2_12_FULL_37_11 TaxID=1797777 RepID=A0A1F5K9U2_9BACT|nr:MAG: hypothetical protein A2111_02575 [Candidatus Daviesbacteria bacterium GWA1_38_6]OGE15971.1 MAG: hypothetical protein A2769_04720 [Candidatus Daviesbacteria bacterium RIFCSPHIGHO2_01_FULL_37_27]OGE37590.1 MAG: hypothetical protein A3F00_04975 [Candidatus Daviesbacteria bacterium RIFCSPHIGHO2_12_FULL_37_11]OGE46027.1 MAG: hypothetical protein A3B39_03395 [Candidatus Daviesbacteria bacterium RIFCSPLOWO2_01_FULL_37_10]
MKNYLLAAGLITISILMVILLPPLFDTGENLLVTTQIEVPENSSETLGLQKYVYPPVNSGFPIPGFSARSVLIKDLTTDTLLFQKDANISFPIASTTKIMTALVANEYFRPNSILTASSSASIGGAKIGLTYGEKLNFRSLLYGMLLNSGNDAAFAIAENYPGGVAQFVKAMNKKALNLNLSSTHFDNPAGFDSPSHYSSAMDLSKITEEALKNPDLAKIFATKETQVSSIDKQQKHKLVNLNKLLTSVSGILGVKTGYTDAAKENLVGLVERNGHKVLTVVLGSDDRFGETEKLVEWAYSNFVWP